MPDDEGAVRHGRPSDDRVRGKLGSRLLGLDWAVPDFSTRRRCRKTLAVTIPYRGQQGPLNLPIDSTGIKAESPMAGDFDRQVAELRIRAAVPNGYTAPGIPVTGPVGYVRRGKGRSGLHALCATKPTAQLRGVECATVEWVDWFNTRRLLEPAGTIPSAEAETNFYAALESEALAT